MTDKQFNPSASQDDGQPRGQRELIVLTKAEAAVRAGPRGLSSESGADVSPLAKLLATAGATLEPLFGNGDAPASRSAQSEEEQRYYSVTAPDERLDAIADELIKDDLVEAAYVKPAGEPPVMVDEPDADADARGVNDMQPSAAPIPAVTPSFIARQGYLNPTPVGVDARYAWRFRGGRGAGVRVIDLEWGWRFTHEDLRMNQGGVIAGANASSTDHGTAVLGEISGDDNGRGVIGISPDAHISAVSFSTLPTARAIRTAADNLRAGDIMLLEIHRAGPRFNFQARGDQRGYIAVEWWPDDFAAIRYAIARGIIVVECAGNGAENFDDALYDTRPRGFPASWRNPFNPANPSSQAVVVGAGAPPQGTNGADHGPDRSRLGFSNHGRRVDAQGWGREVCTTGYGDLQSGDLDREYTLKFSGTSSSGPIVVGALACVQGALRGEGQTLLTPQGAINLLRSTGAPQTDAPGRPRSQRIGNRPDLKTMIDHVVRPATTYTGVWRSGTDPYYLWVNADWANFVSKWQELGQRNLRLVDFEITRFGNVDRYSGVWRQGTDPYYLWVNANWPNFVAKWQELGRRNLRLIDLEIRQFGDEWRYSGVWRGGSDPYYLWVNADWSHFVAKWQELSGRSLRLVDFEIVRMGGGYRYSGVWRHGTDAHYLWVNADWANFVAKWRELAARNLRLTKIVRLNVGGQWRYSGVWRQGSDGYYLWAGASWPNFVDKWSELGRAGLRLVDLEINAPGEGTRSAPIASLGGVMTTEGNDESGSGFGDGMLSGETAETTLVISSEDAIGGGDLGAGFAIAGAVSTAASAAAPTEGGDPGGAGYGGGEASEAAQSRGAAAAPLGAASGESDTGDGYGGGSGEALAATAALEGYGGGELG